MGASFRRHHCSNTSFAALARSPDHVSDVLWRFDAFAKGLYWLLISSGSVDPFLLATKFVRQIDWPLELSNLRRHGYSMLYMYRLLYMSGCDAKLCSRPISTRLHPAYIQIRSLREAYFLRFIVFSHMSRRPSLASESGNPLMAWAALSAYPWARARVCSRPSLRETMSRAYTSLATPVKNPRLRDGPSARRHRRRICGPLTHLALDAASKQTVEARLRARVLDLRLQVSPARFH